MNYNMQRLPYGAQTFEAEVRDLYPKTKIDPGSRDGLGVYRRLDLTFASVEDAEDLGELLVPIMESSDSRITGWLADGDTMSVTFTDTDEAENPEPFYLGVLAMILTPPPEPVSKARKKAAPKTD